MEKVEYTSPLLTDRYMLTMCLSFFRTGKFKQTASFEFFFRTHPFQSNYTIWSGINETIAWLKNARYNSSEIEYIQANLELDPSDPFLTWLSEMRFDDLEIHAVREGEFVYPHIPLLLLKGPLGKIQLTEALILNKLNYPCLISTYASMLKVAAKTSSVVEFGLRRAQGWDGATTGAYYAYIGGADATSNVLAGYKYKIPIIGTMAHSYIMSFDSLEDLEKIERNEEQKKFIGLCLRTREDMGLQTTNDGELSAFINFAIDLPKNFICLVDTFSTLKSGILNYIVVARALEQIGGQPKGIRLDSGNLAQLSLECRRLLDEYSEKYQSPALKASKILASDSISLNTIREMEGKHAIDVFAVGTKLITCYDQAALGMVCKICELDGLPKLKLSETLEKSTLPGQKTVHRVTGMLNGKEEQFDLIATFDEHIGNEVTVYQHQKYKQPLTVQVLSSRNLLINPNTNPEEFAMCGSTSKQRVLKNLELYAPMLQDPALQHRVYITQKLFLLLDALSTKANN
jgi:nicotinate phosphoribosyltransferase